MIVFIFRVDILTDFLVYRGDHSEQGTCGQKHWSLHSYSSDHPVALLPRHEKLGYFGAHLNDGYYGIMIIAECHGMKATDFATAR